METSKALVKAGRPQKYEDGADNSIAQLMDMKETLAYFYGPKKSKDARDQKIRLMALMCTIKTVKQVAALFGVSEKIVMRAWRMYRDELKDAGVTRNMIVAGLSERKAIETLQKLNVDKVPDEKKGRLVKDLMDSAALAVERVTPKEESKDITTTELIYRITHRKPVVVAEVKEGEVIEGELVEQTQIPEKT